MGDDRSIRRGSSHEGPRVAAVWGWEVDLCVRRPRASVRVVVVWWVVGGGEPSGFEGLCCCALVAWV